VTAKLDIQKRNGRSY